MKTPPAAYPRVAVALAAVAVVVRSAAAAVAVAGTAVSRALRTVARTLDTLSAVAFAGGTLPPPIPAAARTEAPTLL